MCIVLMRKSWALTHDDTQIYMHRAAGKKKQSPLSELCLFFSDSHSLVFLSTGRLQSDDQPQFEQLTVFNGVHISYCDSVTKKEQFKPNLESKNLPEHCHEACYNVLESLHEVPPFINSTVCKSNACFCDMLVKYGWTAV